MKKMITAEEIRVAQERFKGVEHARKVAFCVRYPGMISYAEMIDGSAATLARLGDLVDVLDKSEGLLYDWVSIGCFNLYFECPGDCEKYKKRKCGVGWSNDGGYDLRKASQTDCQDPLFQRIIQISKETTCGRL